MATDDENDRVPTHKAKGLVLNRRIPDETIKKVKPAQHDRVTSKHSLYEACSPRKEIRGERGFSPYSKIGESVKLDETLSG